MPRVPELVSLLKAIGVSQEDAIRILASLSTPRAAMAIKSDADRNEATLFAPSGGLLLKTLRSQKQLSLSDVANELGVNASTVSRWETCRSKPSQDQTNKILKLFAASDEVRKCLEESGIAKLKVARPRYDENKLRNRLKKLEQEALDQHANWELHLLQFQSILWWYRREVGGSELLRCSYVAYAEALVKLERYREALEQIGFYLESGSLTFGELDVRAYLAMARSEVFRWQRSRPHLGLYSLQRCLANCNFRPLLPAILWDIAEYSRIAGHLEEAQDYEARAEMLSRERNRTTIVVEDRTCFTPALC
jgi:transcriptional regulator with XRE-family HTH domain